jgi:Bacterial transcriptional activator domain
MTHGASSVPTTPAGKELGPGRFQRFETETERPSIAASLGSAALLLLLVVGIPAALLWLNGVPGLPTSLPTKGQLTATIGVDQLLSILVWVVWLAWLQFTICVLVELRSALSGIGLPARVPLAGPSQRFARTLVVTVLLLVTAAGQASALATSTTMPERASTSVVSTMTGSSVTSMTDTAAVAAAVGTGTDVAMQGAEQSQVAEQGETTYWLGDVQLDAAEGAELVGQRVYVVETPEGRYHDNLWDIADRTLGEGRRYQEIFELNKGRDQPDGQELTLERLIYPNWLMVMPEDATAVARVTAVVAPVAEVAPAPAAEVPLAPVTAELAPDAAIQAGAGHGAVGTPEITAGARDGVGVQALVGAGLLAAGLLVAVERLRRRRRTTEPSGPAVELEVALRVGADPGRAALLDRGLRQLAESLGSVGRDLPGAYSVLVDDTSLELRVAPASAEAPAPWQAQESGSVWRLVAADLDPRAGTGLAPFPGLVSLGRDSGGRDVLIDLEAAQGPISIVGDPRVAVEIASAIAAELATNRWSDRLRVTGIGLPDGLSALPVGRYRAVNSVGDVLPGLRERRADVLGAGVLTGRMRNGGSSGWTPEYVVLGGLPSGDTAQQLVELTATGQRSPLGVVCVGDLPGARWQLVAEADGRLTARILGVTVRANRLTADQVAAVAELLTPAPEPVSTVDERRAAVENEGGVERPAVPVPDRAVEPGDLAAAAVRVHVLGAPRVDTVRTIDESRRALATELVVFLALHPEGVHANVLGAALWPRGVTTEVRESVIDRAAEWLGADASGRPHLVRGPEGRLRLGAGVVVDWDVVRTLLARSRSTPGRDEERAALVAALALAPGVVLSARPAGHYSWLARVRLERASRALLIDATHRLVVLCRDGGDLAGAQSAAWAGLKIAPTEELLWRDLLRAASALGGTAAVLEVAADLVATLHASGIDGPSAPTTALLEDLDPSAASEAPGSA